MKESDFLLEVAKALAGCQAVKLRLKLYLAQAFATARRCIGDTIPFKFSGDDYADSSLERLIDVFKKLSGNDDLVKRLNQFKSKRNSLAHNAIAKCQTDDGSLDEWETAGSFSELNSMQRDVQALLDNIAREHSKLFIIESGIPIPPDTI